VVKAHQGRYVFDPGTALIVGQVDLISNEPRVDSGIVIRRLHSRRGHPQRGVSKSRVISRTIGRISSNFAGSPGTASIDQEPLILRMGCGYPRLISLPV